MKRYIFGLLILIPSILLPALTSCSDGLVPEPAVEMDSDCFNLTVTVPMEGGSRALDPVNDLNEFKVRTVHFYFYVSEGHDDATSKSIYDCVVTEEFDEERVLRVGLPDNALLAGGIFGTSGTECIVYAVANVDNETLPMETPKTIDELKATAIGSTFDQTIVQNDFVMDGRATVTLDRATRMANGDITLTRAAAKLTLSIDIPEFLTVTDNVLNQDGTIAEGETRVYTPNTYSMHVWIDNGVKRSLLSASTISAAEADLYSNKIETTTGIGSAFSFDEAQTQYKYVQNVPFYSYPNEWEATTPNGNTRLTLVVPWTYTDADGNSQQVTTYYRLAVQPEKCRIERNTHYDMRVTIGRLGSTTPQEPTDMTVDWNYAIPWNEETIATDIKEIRYLLLNNNYLNPSTNVYEFQMNNETDIDITFGSSHEVEIESVTMSWRDYLNNANRSGSTTDGKFNYSTIADYNPANYFAGIEVNNDKSTLKFKRDFRHIAWENSRPTITDNAAFCSYTFDIVLRHKEHHNQKATVRITQYPAIYITSQETAPGETERAKSTRFINNNNQSYQVRIQTGTDWRGNPIYTVYPKGYTLTAGTNQGLMPSDETQKKYYLGSLHENFATNKNTYIINISRFDAAETNDYIIADPRTRDVDNLPIDSNDKTATAAWSMSDGSRQLQNYYPADNNPQKASYLAPQLRIASQWGVTFPITRDGAMRRCASYQENGRPAGRWRLPTIGEIQFMATLSCNKYIPFLFGSERNTNNESIKNHVGPATYWCASGAIFIDNDPDNPRVYPASADDTRDRAVRCVYDEWYWGTDTLTMEEKTKFTWGDKPRNISGN